MPHPLQQFYATSVPHCAAMKLEILRVQRGQVQLRQPYAAWQLGDPDGGLIHTSVQLSLVDSGFGAAVLSCLQQPTSIATLDLRMDYQRPAMANHALYMDARIDRMTRQIVFVSGEVWQQTPDTPTALARAAFMLDANKRAVLPAVTA